MITTGVQLLNKYYPKYKGLLTRSELAFEIWSMGIYPDMKTIVPQKKSTISSIWTWGNMNRWCKYVAWDNTKSKPYITDKGEKIFSKRLEERANKKVKGEISKMNERTKILSFEEYCELSPKESYELYKDKYDESEENKNLFEVIDDEKKTLLEQIEEQKDEILDLQHKNSDLQADLRNAIINTKDKEFMEKVNKVSGAYEFLSWMLDKGEVKNVTNRN